MCAISFTAVFTNRLARWLTGSAIRAAAAAALSAGSSGDRASLSPGRSDTKVVDSINGGSALMRDDARFVCHSILGRLPTNHRPLLARQPPADERKALASQLIGCSSVHARSRLAGLADMNPDRRKWTLLIRLESVVGRRRRERARETKAAR